MNIVHMNGFNRPGIRYGFFGREGGVSQGLFHSMNCGLGSGDHRPDVIQNRQRIAAYFDQAPENLVTLYQDHTATAHVIDAPPTATVVGDALVTDRPHLVLGVLTADCVPVLVHGTAPDARPVIAAIHAGWKGALGGIVANTVAAMQGAGCMCHTLTAVIGPCIRQKSYEVRADLRDRFVAIDPANGAWFAPDARPGCYRFDLAGYVHHALAGAGVSTIIDTDLDTYTDSDAFFSYRRATHLGDTHYGRQISAIMIA